MADKYVSLTGTDASGDGSPGNPYRHVYKGVDVAASGDSVIIFDGTYTGELAINGTSVNKIVEIRSYSNDFEKVLIIPSSLGNTGASYAKAWLGHTGGTVRPTIKNLSIALDYSAIGTGWVPGGYYSNGLFFAYSPGSRITLLGCALYGRNLPASSSGSGYSCALNMSDQSELYLYKSTIRGFKSNGWSAGLYNTYNSEATGTVIDCIFEGNDTAMFWRYGTSLKVELNNCFYHNGTNYLYGAVTAGTVGTLNASTLTSNPLFSMGTDSAVIPASSPCYDAGIIVPGITAYLGNAPDIGCYEAEAEILLYTGTYNDGSSAGTVNFTPSLLQVGRVSEVLVTDVARPWVQQTNVSLDDAAGYFVGTFSRGNQWLDGTFTLQRYVGSTWQSLFLGHVPSSAWSIDYGQQIINLSITSMLSKAAAYTLGYGTGVYGLLEIGSADRTSPFFMRQGTLGTTNDGTLTVWEHSVYAPWEWKPFARLFEENPVGTVDVNNQTPSVLKSASSWTVTSTGTYSSVITLQGGTQPWMVPGKTIVQSVPWPSRFAYGNSKLSLFDTCGSKLGFSWGSTNRDKFAADLAFIPMAYTCYHQYQPPPDSLGSTPLYHGPDRWVEVMNDLMNSVGANWTVDGAGGIRARIKRTSVIESSLHLLDFEKAEGDVSDQWVANSSTGPSLITVYHDWNETENQWDGTAQKKGSAATGDMFVQNARWQRGIGGQLLANRLMHWESVYGRIFSLQYPVSYWNTFVPGGLLSLYNIPASVAPSGGTEGNYIVMARHYDYSEMQAVVELRHAPIITGIFTLDSSALDGPDILY